MKLLIVDDEELTRTGVISAMDWKELGISEIYQADDGVHGLEAARLYRPELILCDVRMPRMDGITMLGELEQILPDTVPIFMSGYSDKEYLKAAIRLKAVNYIEKPINPAEIREAILEAKEVYAQKIRSNQGASFHSIETESRIALQLTVPYGTNEAVIGQMARELNLEFTDQTWFTSFIVKTNTAAESEELPVGLIPEDLKNLLSSEKLDCICAEKRGQYLVYFIYGKNPISEEILGAVQELLHRAYQEFGSHFVAVGDPAKGVSQAYRSYASAVILLQSSYFFPEGSILTSSVVEKYRKEDSHFCSREIPPASVHPALPATPDTEFSRMLAQKDQHTCAILLEQLYQYFDHNCSLLPNQAKDLYYKLFLALSDAHRQMTGTLSEHTELIADTLDRCFTYQQLHQILCERTEAFFLDLQKQSQDSPTIVLIKDYIAKNYSNETLSVKDIGAHVFLSASYVCTYFKNETGQTLNQYLTEYRMEKAKQLLGDPRYRITDISSRVGYSDGNYFGKSFKKYSGLSPSEYREKTLR